VQPATIDVTVHEGTSMSVAISPDGRTIADRHAGQHLDDARRRRRDDAHHRRLQRRAPADVVARRPHHRFFAYRDGGYDIWAINPDGTNQRKLTWGTYDDREPIFSHDGTRIAFSSDRGDALGSDYNIWTLDLRTHELRQITKNPSEDFMPTWFAGRQRDRPLRRQRDTTIESGP
jgi:hypothetical protein